ncbi:hypothetical protein [Flavobacterium sp.]|uniref:hypothetical protein n=1 Tax=Flavobacterium sp. TaxID=239 RepID=UPI0038FCD489
MEKSYKHKISKSAYINHKTYLKSALTALNLNNPKWHPEWKRNLGYKIARVLFLAGVKKIEHTYWDLRQYDLMLNEPPLHKQTIRISPNIDSSVLEIFDKMDKSRPLIWNILSKFNIGVTGCGHENFCTVSNVEEMNLLTDILIHFNHFNNNFEIEKTI